MKSLYFVGLILIIFYKTGNVLSNENIFSVNNIEISKNTKLSNEELANKAIKLGFRKLIEKILLEKDIEKLSSLKLDKIKPLVSYYQLINKREENLNLEKCSLIFSLIKKNCMNYFTRWMFFTLKFQIRSYIFFHF